MNKIYKSIYNEVLGTWVAISEVAKAGGKKSKSKMLSSVLFGLVMACAGVAGEAWGESSENYQVGQGSQAQGGDTTSVGINNKALATKATAVGNSNEINGKESLAAGALNIVKKERSIALGVSNYNEGSESFTYGYMNYGIGIHSKAVGNYNFALGSNSSVFGDESYAGDISQFSLIKSKNKNLNQSETLDRLGNLIDKLKEVYSIQPVSQAKNGLAVGYYSFSFNNYSLAIGNSTISSGIKSVALGSAAVSLNTNDIAIGTNALAGFSDKRINEITWGDNNENKIDNALLGKNGRFDDLKVAHRPKLNQEKVIADENIAKAQGNLDSSLNGGASSQIAIGEDTVAMGKQVIAVGATNRSFGTNSSAVGKGNFAHGNAAQAFGNWNISSGSNTVAVGNRNDSTGTKSIAAGFENRSYGIHTTSIGYQNQTEANYSSAVGNSNKVINGEFSNAFGYKNSVFSKGSTSIGIHNIVSGFASIAYGAGNEVIGNHSIAIGSGMITGDNDNSSVVDKSSVSGNYSISIGYKNNISDNNTVAFGNSINSNGTINSVVLGHESVGIKSLSISGPVIVPFGGLTSGIDIGKNWTGHSSEANGSVSIGSNGKERQIKNVATGAITASSTDAINGSQLYSAIMEIGGVPLNFKGDNQTKISRKLGEALSFSGGADVSNLSENNIGVNETNGTFELKLSKTIENITSLTTESGTKISNNGFEVEGGPSVTKAGIDANHKQIINVQDGSNGTDVANINNVTTAINNLKGEGYTFQSGDATPYKFRIGETIALNADENLGITVNNGSINFALKKDLQNIRRINIDHGPTLDTSGLVINENLKLTNQGLKIAENMTFNNNGLTVGKVFIDPISGKISGVSRPINSSDVVNLEFLTEKLSALPPGEFSFEGNDGGRQTFVLGSNFIFKGNSSFVNTDEGANIATKSSAGKIIIGLNKNLIGLDSAKIGTNLIDRLGITVSGGPKLDSNGLAFENGTKISSDQLKVGNVIVENGFISGLQKPSNDDHAVNKKFVDDSISNAVLGLTTGGIQYAGNEGGIQTLALGGTLNVVGNTKYAESDEGTNIATKSSSGKISIALSKKINGINSAVIGGNTINEDGFRVSEGPSITKSGIDANNKIIQNVAYGSADNDASNVRFVKDKIQALKEEGYILKADEGEGKKFAIGTSVVFYGDKNITSEVTSEGFKTKLNSSLTDIESLEIKDGPLLNSEGLSFDEKTKFTKELVKVGSVQITSDGKISGIQTPTEDNHVTNKGYVDGQIAMVKNNLSTLQDSPLNFATNIGDTPKKLGETVSIKGDDSNNNVNKNEFDSSNVMTWIDDKGILRIGVRKDIKLSKIKAEDASSGQSSELTPNSLVFNGVDNKSGEDGKITLDVTTNGEADVTGKTAPRLQINGVDFATLNDGMKYVANSGQPQNVKLNNTITVKGAEKNTDVTLFDGGENVMTTIKQDGMGVKYTVAFKKVPEFAGLTVGGMLAKEISPNIKLKSKDGEEKFSATVDEEGAGIVTVTGNDSELKTDLMHDGLTINDVDGFSKLGTSTEGMGSLSTPDKTKRRLTHSYNIGSEEVVDEELATLNDGLKIEANIADGSGHASLNTKVKIVGSDKNRTWEEFDSGYNIMTKIEKTEDGETVIRVALRNDLNVKSGSFGGSGTDGFLNIKNEHGKEGITITPSEIRFNNTKKLLSKDHNQQDEVSMGITMTHSGSPNLLSGESVTRIQITDNSGTPTAEVATMNDGLRFKGDTEDVLEKPLSNTLTIIGGESDASKLTALEDKNIGVIAHNLSANDTKISSEKVLTVRMSRNLKGLHSAEFKTLDESGNASGKSIRIDDAGVTIAKGEKGVQLSEEGLTLGEKGPSITNNGINAGGMSISNVGIPTEAHHASSKGYVDRELANVQGQLGSKIQEARKDSLGGAAMAMATAGLPQAYKPGKSAFAVSGGVVAGQSAFAMGLSTISEDGKWIIKGSVSSDSRSQVGGSIGAAYQW
ncbi:YadA-like family protein [Taylorella equigenitalis]|uniref:YadA-like family protein n=1 Tax=Taylorella equigenitalis TaxID=29575 RepID=UPI00041AF4F6|nr:YadA-like family protein [Taylorella equigenitalis]WDU53674.1 YadA-like family protein [Taylorella equigenitalis]